jgi:hypothetical protein
MWVPARSNDSQHNDIQSSDTQHYGTLSITIFRTVTFRVTTLRITDKKVDNSTRHKNKKMQHCIVITFSITINQCDSQINNTQNFFKGKMTDITQSRNTKGGSITVPLTSCLTGLD